MSCTQEYCTCPECVERCRQDLESARNREASRTPSAEAAVTRVAVSSVGNYGGTIAPVAQPQIIEYKPDVFELAQQGKLPDRAYRVEVGSLAKEVGPTARAWECPRCGAMNAPSALQCTCKPHESGVHVTIPMRDGTRHVLYADRIVHDPAPVTTTRDETPGQNECG